MPCNDNAFDGMSEEQRIEIERDLAWYEHCAKNNIALKPELSSVALLVRFQRLARQWKQETLASFAGVSLSTIERIERGDFVSKKCMDQVAVALDYKINDFTESRVPLSNQNLLELVDRCLQRFDQRRWINVELIRKQRQIAELADCESQLIDGSRFGTSMSESISELFQWIDLASFIRSEPHYYGKYRERRPRRRVLYTKFSRIFAISNEDFQRLPLAVPTWQRLIIRCY